MFDRETLLHLRKQVRQWLTSEGKNETRGDAIIPKSEKPEFLKALKEIIPSLQSRSFRAFRNRVLIVIRRIRLAASRKFRGNEFSKRYWSGFLKENPEIETLWNRVPKANSRHYQNLANSNLSDDDEGFDDCLGSESNDCFESQDNLPIFSAQEIEDFSVSPVAYPSQEEKEKEEESFHINLWNEWMKRSIRAETVYSYPDEYVSLLRSDSSHGIDWYSLQSISHNCELGL